MKRFPRKIAIDTSVLLALVLARDAHHEICRKQLSELPDATEFIATEACLTELFYLLPEDPRSRAAVKQLFRLLSIRIRPLDSEDLDRILELQDRYHDLPMDFADATVVVACEKLGIDHVFTLDRRDFSVYKPVHAAYFKLLPST